MCVPTGEEYLFTRITIETIPFCWLVHPVFVMLFMTQISFLSLLLSVLLCSPGWLHSLNLLPKASKGWDCRLTTTPIFQSRFYFKLVCLFLALPSAPLSSLYPFSSPMVFNYPRLCDCIVTYLSSLDKHPG